MCLLGFSAVLGELTLVFLAADPQRFPWIRAARGVRGWEFKAPAFILFPGGPVDALYPFTAAHHAIQEACARLLAAQDPGRRSAAGDRSLARYWFGMAEDQLHGVAYPEAHLVIAPPEDIVLFHEPLGTPWSTGVQTLEAFQALRTSALAAGNAEDLVHVLAQLRTLISRRHPGLLAAEAAAIMS